MRIKLITYQRKNTVIFPYKSKHIAILFPILLLVSPIAFAQNVVELIDSLEKKLPVAIGEEKVTILSDLCWYNRAVDGEKAFSYGRKALREAQKIDYQKGVAQAYNDIGILHIDNGAFSKALAVFDSALVIREELKDTLGIAALYNKIGIVYQNKRDIDKALEASLKALKIYERKQIPHYAAYCLNNIAILYHDQNNYKKSIEFHKRVIGYRKTIDNAYDLGASYLNLGNVLTDDQQIEQGLVYYDSALTLLSSYPEKEGYAACLSSMGSAYTQINQNEKALEYLKEAFTLRKKMGNQTFITTTQLNLGRCLFNLGSYKLAKQHLDSALTSALSLGIKEHIKQAYFFLSDYYDKVGNTQQAYESFQYFHAYSDSINNEDVNEKVAEMQTQYETEKKEQEILTLSQQNQISALKIEQRNAQIQVLVLLFLLLSGFGIAAYLRYRERQKRKLNEAIISEQQKGLRAVIEATENERQRIAKDLHDGIGQTLSGIKLSLGQFIDHISDTKKEQFDKVQHVIDEACTEVRSISHQMMPKSLEEGGLVPAIEGMLEKSLGFSKVKYSFDHTLVEENRYPRSIEIGLYRIAQELINNIIKHAEATKVDVQLYQTKSHLVLFVEDDGKGFTFEQNKDGIGLTNIRSRASTFNGEVNYENAPNKGTAATIRIPLRGNN